MTLHLTGHLTHLNERYKSLNYPTTSMPSKITEIPRSAVIEKWLLGLSRREISDQCGVGEGAVSSIIDEFKRPLGPDLAQQLRDLALALNKQRISPSQCAIGFRIASIMINMGVNEEAFESFVADTYARCTGIGMRPQEIARYLEDLDSFSVGNKNETGITLISQIPEFIAKMKNEKKRLQVEIGQLVNEISNLRKEKAAIEQARDDSLKQKELTSMELNWYMQLKEKLREMGIPVENTRRFAEAVRWIRDIGYRAADIITTYSNFQTLKLAFETLKEKVSRSEKRYDGLQQQVWEVSSALEVLKDSSSRTRSELEILKAHGFGLRELKSLTGLINEISEANGISIAGNYAVKEFFASLVNQYETKLGFETTIRERQR
jgi:predicted  nucleic acid-binding Zn-ribbon protein